MLTATEIDYLVRILKEVGTTNQQLLQTFLILIYNNDAFASWVLDIFQYCDLQLATEFIIQAINDYESAHIQPLPPF